MTDILSVEYELIYKMKLIKQNDKQTHNYRLFWRTSIWVGTFTLHICG